MLASTPFLYYVSLFTIVLGGFAVFIVGLCCCFAFIDNSWSGFGEFIGWLMVLVWVILCVSTAFWYCNGRACQKVQGGYNCHYWQAVP